MTRAPRKVTGNQAVRAPLRTSVSTAQPLKPLSVTVRGVIVLGVLFVATAGLLISNYDNVAGFINRPITKIRIENQWQRIQENEVSALLASFMGAGFFNFDVNGVKRGLEQHPWIEHASVKRLWPDSLSLNITEQVAIARWGDSQILNQRGQVFEPPGIDNLGNLPLLAGPAETQAQVMETYQQLSQMLFSSGLRLTALSLSSRGSWDLQLNDSIEVAVGRSEVIGKVKRFVEFYDAQPAVETMNYQTVDLRYDNGIAVKSIEQDFVGVAGR